jgi:hypothetical protein
MEFAQFVAQLPEDALNDVILQFQMGGLQREDGRMPGDFGNGGINVDGDDGQGEHRDEEVPDERVVEEELGGEHDDEANDEDEEDEDGEASPVSDGSYRVHGG